MKNFKKLFAVIIAVMVVMSSMSTVLLGTLVSADTVTADLTISTVDGLNDFADAVNNGNNYAGKTVTLSNDIDMGYTGVTIGTKEKPFKGTFDGMGHTIDNLTIYYENDSEAFSQSYVGLFGFTDGAVIKNVTVNNPYIVGKSYVGGIVGCAYTGTVENCHVTGEIDIEGYYMVGGITGQGYAKIIDCSVIGAADWDYSYIGATYFQSDLEGDNVGGIIGFSAEGNGQNIVKISGCEVANVTVSGTRKVGGVAGSAYQNNSIVGCDVSNVTVTTTSTADYASSNASSMAIGGIVGLYLATNDVIGNITDCTVEDIILIDENNVGVNMGYVTGGLRVNGVYSAPAVVATNIVVSGENTGATVNHLVPVAIPSATVTDIAVKDLLVSKAPELTFAKKFVADKATEDTVATYGDWYADFILTVNKDVTFNGNGTADGYLAGQYDEWSENWVLVPITDVTLKAGESLKIMEYAASLMGESGLKLTYNDVYSFVKEFDCGIFFNDEFLAANPDLKVDLGLQIFNPENEEETFVIHPEETFLPEDAIVYPEIPSATVTDLKAKDLPADTELTFAKKFVADEADTETIEAYEEWFSDFVLVVNKDVTFNADGSADGYLAGQYEAAFGDTWIKVPDRDITIKANEPVKIMELAAELLNQPALKITYNDILNFVKEFNCGVYFDEEFKAANPDVTVSLELQVFNPVYESESITIHEAEKLDLSDAIIYNPEIGDVNADGKIDAADIALIRQALLGFVEADEYFNVNGDESFDVRDLVKIKKLTAKVGTVVSDADSLSEALASGSNVVLTGDITADAQIEMTNGGAIDGNGATINATAVVTDSDCAVVTTGGTVKNVTIELGGEGTRGIGSGSSGNYTQTEDLYVNNVIVDGGEYAINTSGNRECALYVTDSTLNGWTSYACLTVASFENVNFGLGDAYDPYGKYGITYGGYLAIQSDSVFTNCNFDKDFHIGLGADEWKGVTITLNNCYYDGVLITADNYSEYLVYPSSVDGDSTRYADVTVIVNGVEVDVEY